jgi:hypothetical protein
VIISECGRSCLSTGYFDSLLPYRHGFLMALGNMDTTYVNFLFENETTLDDNYLFDDR